jgi:tRNA/rRNA methyltransferase
LPEALRGTTLAVAMTARRRELAVPALWARDAAAELMASAGSGEVALVFGNETSGLSNDELAMCRRWAMIPVNAGIQFAQPCGGGPGDVLRVAPRRD